MLARCALQLTSNQKTIIDNTIIDNAMVDNAMVDNSMVDAFCKFENDAPLDNPIWNSLTSCHQTLALGANVGRGLARRYPDDVSPLSGFQEPTAEAYADLAAIVPEDDVAVLFLKEEPTPPAGWQYLHGGVLVQMVCPVIPPRPSLSESIVQLDQEDFPEMVALATLTEPGPFRDNTATVGGFLGIRTEGCLAAMAGHRLAPTGWTEVSGVCSHPAFRGRGYAKTLVAAVTRNIFANGRMPFLGSFEGNSGAIRIYKEVGFVVRRTLHLAVLKPPSPSSKRD